MNDRNERRKKSFGRLEWLYRTRETASKMLENAPVGRLRISSSGASARYYHVLNESNREGIYIRKSQIKLTLDLAQKSYLQDLIRSIDEEIEVWEKCSDELPMSAPEEVYSKLSPERKSLVSPLVMTNEEYAAFWQAKKFVPNPYLPEEKKFATKRGELVRSKSEAMIADCYYELGIPYKCDFPVDVGNPKPRYVDFAALDVRSRKVIYHEHFGRMDKPDYVQKNLIKLDEYARVGIFPGKNLHLTFETETSPLDMNQERANLADLFGIE